MVSPSGHQCLHMSRVMVTMYTWNVNYEGVIADIMTAELHGNIESRNLELGELNCLTLEAAGKGSRGRGIKCRESMGKEMGNQRWGISKTFQRAEK